GDIGVDLAADSAPALFGEAARALTLSLTDAPDLRPAQTLRVVLRHDALDLLLVDWLSELLFRFEVDGFLASGVEVDVRGGADGWTLTAAVRGEPGAAWRVPIKVLVKAITYHGLLVERHGDAWRARVVFDI
ncbi:MAG TPA: archease, partial [Vicinamibacterales bacterium]|nr:archease [Vicinamibacterales bacterium]